MILVPRWGFAQDLTKFSGRTCTNGGDLSTTTTSWQTVSGSIASNGFTRHDVYLTSGRQYIFSLCSDDGGAASIDTYMGLFNGWGCDKYTSENLLAYNDDGCGTASKITYTATSTGWATLYITAYYTNTSGTYTLKYKYEDNSAPVNSSCSSANTLSCGSTLSGTTKYTPGNAHNTGASVSNYGVWYTFTGTGFNNLISATPSSGYDIRLVICKGSCSNLTLLYSNDNYGSGTAESQNFETESGTTYYVYIAYYGSNGSSSDTGDFTISRTCTTPSYSITANIWPSAGGTVSGNTTVIEGSTTTLTATANSGYQFVNWTDSDGDVVSSSATLSLTNVTSDATYQANFTSTSATSLLWTENFESYSNVTSSNWGYLNGEWATPLRDNKAPCVTYYSAAATSGYRSLELRADNSTNMVVLPQFNQALNSLLISFQIGRGNNSSGYTVELGYVTNPSDASTFTALTTIPTPSSAVGSHTLFSYNLATNNNTPSSTNYRLAIRYMMTGSDSWYLDDFSVSVPTYTVTTTVSPSGAGSVSGLASGGTYTNGSTCSLTATPTANSGYTFTNWTENNTEVSSNATYSFTVTDNHNLTANFTLASYSITVTANPMAGGTVIGGGTYSHGASVTLSATANTGYNFVNWTENGTVVSTSASYTFTATAAGDYVANFEERCPSPTDLVASANNNSITVTWNGGSASSWQVYVSSSNSAPSASDSGTPTSTNSYTEGSLSVGQTRYFWVRTDCGNNEYSAWVGPVYATTACTAPTNLVAYPSSTGAVLTWDGGMGEGYTVELGTQGATTQQTLLNQGFEGGSMPSGWTPTGTWSVSNGTSNNVLSNVYSGTYDLIYTSSSSSSGNIYYITMPALDLSGATSATLSLHYANPYYS